MTGDTLGLDEAANAAYWVDQTCSTIRFDRAIARVLGRGPALFLSIGPGADLCTFVRECAGFAGGQAHVTLTSFPSATEAGRTRSSLLGMVGGLWECGFVTPK